MNVRVDGTAGRLEDDPGRFELKPEGRVDVQHRGVGCVVLRANLVKTVRLPVLDSTQLESAGDTSPTVLRVNTGEANVQVARSG